MGGLGGQSDFRESPEFEFLFPFGLALGTWTRAYRKISKVMGPGQLNAQPAICMAWPAI